MLHQRLVDLASEIVVRLPAHKSKRPAILATNRSNDPDAFIGQHLKFGLHLRGEGYVWQNYDREVRPGFLHGKVVQVRNALTVGRTEFITVLLFHNQAEFWPLP